MRIESSLLISIVCYIYKAGTNITIIPKEQIWLQFDQQQTNYRKNTI